MDFRTKMSSKLLYRFFDFFSASESKYRNHVVPFPIDLQIIISPNAHGKIVGFYTSNTFYEHEAARMVASAKRLGLLVHTTVVDSTGSWVRNAALKPTFLLEARREHRGPLLYVDVDAVFHRDPWPIMTTFSCDLAVYREADRLISATILLHDTPATLRLLEVWKERCDQDPEIWDQIVLQEILDEDRASESPQYQVGELPLRFVGSSIGFQTQRPMQSTSSNCRQAGRPRPTRSAVAINGSSGARSASKRSKRSSRL